MNFSFKKLIYYIILKNKKNLLKFKYFYNIYLRRMHYIEIKNNYKNTVDIFVNICLTIRLYLNYFFLKYRLYYVIL